MEIEYTATAPKRRNFHCSPSSRWHHAALHRVIKKSASCQAQKNHYSWDYFANAYAAAAAKKQQQR